MRAPCQCMQRQQQQQPKEEEEKQQQLALQQQDQEQNPLSRHADAQWSPRPTANTVATTAAVGTPQLVESGAVRPERTGLATLVDRRQPRHRQQPHTAPPFATVPPFTTMRGTLSGVMTDNIVRCGDRSMPALTVEQWLANTAETTVALAAGSAAAVLPGRTGGTHLMASAADVKYLQARLYDTMVRGPLLKLVARFLHASTLLRHTPRYRFVTT